MTGDRLRVLVLARSYPNPVLPQLGLWTEQPTVRLAELCDVRVVSPVPWCPPMLERGPLRQYARFRRVPRTEVRNGVEVAHPRMPAGPGTLLYPLDARAYAVGVTGVAERMHRAAPFDLVHAHFVYPDAVVASRLSARFGVPFVFTEHAPWTGWLDRRGVAPQALPAARAAAAILAVSTSVERTIRAYAGDAPRVEVVPVGVDVERFRPRPEVERVPGQILFVGFVNYVKGVDVLLDAMARLAASGGPGRLLLVGGSFYRNTRLQEERLREHARTLGLGDRVAFLGRRSPDEVAMLMAASEVVVLPSRAESFGAVLVEALACGTPVVATRCGGPEDIVTDGVGELVPVGDAEALAAALARVLAEPGRLDPARLRAHAVARFGWDGIVRRTFELYEDVTGRRPAAVGDQALAAGGR